MELRKIKVRVKSITPLLMSKPTLVDPLHPATKAMKSITQKTRKSDADEEAKSEMEWFAALYANEKGEPVIPPQMFETSLREGAAKVRKSKEAVAGTIFPDEIKLQYKGPKTAEALHKDKRFVDRRRVVLKGITAPSVMRTRPIFTEWSAEFVIRYDPEIVSKEDVVAWFQTAGVRCGIGNWRPSAKHAGRFGRYTVEVVK